MDKDTLKSIAGFIGKTGIRAGGFLIATSQKAFVKKVDPYILNAVEDICSGIDKWVDKE